MTVIAVPPVDHPRSALDGLSLLAIDTDPAANLAALVTNAPGRGQRVVAIVPHTFRNRRDGFLIVLRDLSG